MTPTCSALVGCELSGGVSKHFFDISIPSLNSHLKPSTFVKPASPRYSRFETELEQKKGEQAENSRKVLTFLPFYFMVKSELQMNFLPTGGENRLAPA